MLSCEVSGTSFVGEAPDDTFRPFVKHVSIGDFSSEGLVHTAADHFSKRNPTF